MIDLVVDTNVMLHAANPRERRREAAVTLLRALLGSAVELCVDEGFHVEAGRNRSTIGGEYRRHLQPGSIGFAVVARLAVEGRVRQLARRPGRAAAKRINQLVRNTVDRTFLGVAYNSEGKVLVSHDFTDFPAGKRKQIYKEMGVRIMDAGECDLSA